MFLSLLLSSRVLSQLSQWAIVTSLVFKFSIYKRKGSSDSERSLHPLCVAALSGLIFWVGNSGIVFGRHVYVAKWMRDGLSRLAQLFGVMPAGSTMPAVWWEEMATFHFFGMFGNDCLFRSYIWVACAEVGWHHEREQREARELQQAHEERRPVSYTHLTLPTILLV